MTQEQKHVGVAQKSATFIKEGKEAVIATENLLLWMEGEQLRYEERALIMEKYFELRGEK